MIVSSVVLTPSETVTNIESWSNDSIFTMRSCVFFITFAVIRCSLFIPFLGMLNVYFSPLHSVMSSSAMSERSICLIMSSSLNSISCSLTTGALSSVSWTVTGTSTSADRPSPFVTTTLTVSVPTYDASAGRIVIFPSSTVTVKSSDDGVTVRFSKPPSSVTYIDRSTVAVPSWFITTCGTVVTDGADDAFTTIVTVSVMPLYDTDNVVSPFFNAFSTPSLYDATLLSSIVHSRSFIKSDVGVTFTGTDTESPTFITTRSGTSIEVISSAFDVTYTTVAA